MYIRLTRRCFLDRDGFPGLIETHDDLTDPGENPSKAFCSKLIGFARFPSIF